MRARRGLTFIIISLWGAVLHSSWAASSSHSIISPHLIAPHIEKLQPYQAPILAKLDAYNPLIQQLFKRLADYSLPNNLILLPMLESSYNPNAVSAANAAGLWQLIPATATRFGLTVNAQKDERFDIDASSTAALKYLNFLYQKFDGDINLTLAAYNAGEGRVQRAINRSGSRDFNHLSLPAETRQYVLRYHALLTLVDMDRFTVQNRTTLFLFAQQQHRKPTALIDLTPLPALISL